MRVQVIHEAFARARSDVAEATARLERDCVRIDRRMSAFLGTGWTGIAAESFAEGWTDWTTGADDVREGLVSMGELLDAAHRDFVEADDSSQQKLDQLSTRLIDRLG